MALGVAAGPAPLAGMLATFWRALGFGGQEGRRTSGKERDRDEERRPRRHGGDDPGRRPRKDATGRRRSC